MGGEGVVCLGCLGAVLAVVARYYYLVVARRMYIEAPTNPAPIPVPAVLMVAIGGCVAGILIMGVYPEPWVRAFMRVAMTLFSTI